MQLVLYLSPNAITITPVNSLGEYPLLDVVGTLRLAARAGTPTGLGVGETGSLSVQLDNSSRQAARLVGRPLRCRAEVLQDDGTLIFEGTVAACTYGRAVVLDLEP